MNGSQCSPPSHFPPHLVAAIHSGHKSAIAAEFAASGIGMGIVPYHGVRADYSCTCGDFNCPDVGKHPDTRLTPHGVRNATLDPSVAAQWFTCYPDYNLALVLGKGLAAVDVDPRHGGTLNADYGLPTKTMTANTGGGGQHRLYRIRRDTHVTGYLLSNGAELRTGNQAVVIEKSRHRSGGYYEWLQLDATIAFLPIGINETRAFAFPDETLYFTGSPISSPLLPSIVPAEEVARVRTALLRDKYRDQARVLLGGKWEDAGHPSQSEAEYQLVLLLSRVTDDPAVWWAVLKSSGLGQRDREGSRGGHGRRHKLDRSDYIAALFSKVTAQRAILRSIGDPNLAVVRRVMQPCATCQKAQTPPADPTQQGNVRDPKKKARGRPRGSRKRQAARNALIRFLSDPQTVADKNGYTRLPVGPAAEALAVSVETLRKAVHDLIHAGVIEGPEPKAYVQRGRFARDRYLRLALPYPEAMERNKELADVQ